MGFTPQHVAYSLGWLVPVLLLIMNRSFRHLLAVGLASLALLSTSHAQIWTGSVTATGDEYTPAAQAKFTFFLNATENRLYVDVDNTLANATNTGAITSFGFNIPTTLIASTVLVDHYWTQQNANRNPIPTKWNLTKNYDLSGQSGAFVQDVGALSNGSPGGGGPGNGILFGEKSTFIFGFNDFDTATGFLGTNGLSVRWHAVGANGQGSDKSVDNVTLIPLMPPIPEPSTYGIVAALVILGAISSRARPSRRRQREEQAL